MSSRPTSAAARASAPPRRTPPIRPSDRPPPPPGAGQPLLPPRDLADLNNALLVCGDIRTATTQARDCVIQLATDRRLAVHRRGRPWIWCGASPAPRWASSARPHEPDHGPAVRQRGTAAERVRRLRRAHRQFGAGPDRPRNHLRPARGARGSVIAHEMFHGWLGEAIRQTDPATLWFTEGATTWYAARMLTAAGIWSPSTPAACCGPPGARLRRATPCWARCPSPRRPPR